MSTLIERLSDEADQCRNDGAEDIARLLDEARAALSAPSATSKDQEREAFEHYFSDGGKSPRSVERGADGKYLLGSAHNAWRVWQASRAAMAPAGEPVACARGELVVAIHSLASDFENALGAFGSDAEARRKAEGDIAHARSVAARHNQNGPGCPSPATDRAEVLRLFTEYRSMMT